ncbi:MAG: hypothetical protein PHS31_04970 [Victivallaceae bacterium]|nr:hypothetical protein [Victivallaceae bacterium]
MAIIENTKQKKFKKRSSTLHAGVAKSDITTDEPGVVVNDPLYAKVLILNDGKIPVVIITMDVTAIGGRKISDGALPDVGEDFLPNLRGRIERELQIPGCNVLVNASHTHPPGQMLCSDEEQVERTFDAVRRAVENMMPVHIGFGKGREERISMNRTLRLKDGKHWTIRHSIPSPPDDVIENAGPIDHEIGIIRVDHLDGTPLAVVYNFACHLLFGDYLGHITANIPDYASKVIESNLGNGAMALFLQGAAGDVCDTTFKEFNRPRDVAQLGSALGQSTLNAWRKIKTDDATLKVISETVKLPRRTDINERVAELRQEQNALLASLRFTSLNFESFLPLYLKSERNLSCLSSVSPQGDHQDELSPNKAMATFNQKNIGKYLRNIRAMENLSKIEDDIATLRKHQKLNEQSGEDTIDAEVMGIRIGNGILISSPAETLVEIGMNIKKSSSFSNTFVLGYTNGYLHYGCPASYYNKGGYEVTECLLAPEWQDIYEKKVTEIINKLESV